MTTMQNNENNVRSPEFAFGHEDAAALLARYGSPLYIYDEKLLRVRCRDLTGMTDFRPFQASVSVKSNNNPFLAEIMANAGLTVDAMSPGEILLMERAGLRADQIFFVPNNVACEEMAFAVEHGVLVSIDSIAQLQLFAANFPGKPVALRFNPGVGDGHHAKVVTAGARTKFGILPEEAAEAREIIAAAGLILKGINQHIGSGYLQGDNFLEAARRLLAIASEFDQLEFVDFGGGFGIPYRRRAGEKRLDLQALGAALGALMEDWCAQVGYRPEMRVEPGRYPVAECGVLLGQVHAVKQRDGVFIAGTDLGFNVLMRPVLYDSYHEMDLLGPEIVSRPLCHVDITGNICESGDLLARDRLMPQPRSGDMLLVRDAGAYGMTMASNYNARLRPAEVLIATDGTSRLIRRRDRHEDILSFYMDL